ncbi:MAG: GspE/PulE family protein, partial [Fusobacteriaceae bacterium]
MKTQILRDSPKENVDSQNRKKMENILNELSGTDMSIAYEGIFGDTSLDVEQSLSKDSPIIIKGFSAILVNAVEMGATDIHIEAYEESVRIRYRVDGGLIEVKKLGKSVLNALVSRVKILSNLDIAERRLPQDGRMKLKIMGKDIDFRIAIMPTVFGEKVAIRILDKTALDMKLDKLGFNEEEYEKIIKAISKPHGIILVTGPTGSGKSTTLYSILNNLNTEDVNISTVEDPVEYNIDGINQVQAKPEIGLTFAASLRQFLRQDPDIIMVGEVRDGETAEIAIKAALTGHLVLSTLHTNDAVGTIFRLMNMGVQPFLISASLV